MDLCQCNVCSRPFDYGDRAPKIISCGHSTCLTCLRRLKRVCPHPGCGKKYVGPPDNLSSNRTALEIFARREEEEAQKPAPSFPVETAEAVVQTDVLPDVVPKASPEESKPKVDVKPNVEQAKIWWCTECQREATTQCVDEHTVRSLRAVRAKRSVEVKGHLDALAAAEESVSSLSDLLDTAARDVGPELEACRYRLEAERCVLAEARDRLETALDADAEAWEKEKARQAEPDHVLPRQAGSFLADVAAPEVTCSVTVVAAEEGAAAPASWQGAVSLGGDPVAKLLVCRLLCRGALRREAPDLQAAQRRQREEEERAERLRREQEQQQQQQLEQQQQQQQQQLEQQQQQQQQQLERQQREERERLERQEQIERERQEELREELELAATAAHWKDQSNEAGALGAEEMSARVRVGSRVVPGRDWAGERGCRVGTVTRVLAEGRACVRWANKPGVSEHRIGQDGKHCLRLRPGLAMHYARMSGRFQCAPVRNLEEVSRSEDILEKTRILASGELSRVRSLVSLRCNVSPAWAERVLLQAAPQLESLVVEAPGRQHLHVIGGMARLRRLCITSAVSDAALPLHLEELYLTKTVTQEQLARVSEMPRLRRLEVHCPVDGALPATLRFPRAAGGAEGLQWLRTGVHPLATALALLRAHARSLEELELVAASDNPYGCPDLGRELRRCRLTRLKRLVLIRETMSGFCRHEAAACRQQKVALWDAMIETGSLPVVLCSVCDDLDHVIVVE